MFRIMGHSEKLDLIINKSYEEIIADGRYYGKLLDVWCVETFGYLDEIIVEILIEIDYESPIIKYFRFPFEEWLNHRSNDCLDDLRKFLKLNHLGLWDLIGEWGRVIIENGCIGSGNKVSNLKNFFPELDEEINICA